MTVDLERMRKSLGLRQIDVADATGINVISITLYEQGKRLPTVKRAKVLADFYTKNGLKLNWTQFFEDVNYDRLELQTKNPETK